MKAFLKALLTGAACAVILAATPAFAGPLAVSSPQLAGLSSQVEGAHWSRYHHHHRYGHHHHHHHHYHHHHHHHH